ncbi:tripartite tricarboxylate transporter substrate binding protein [Roseomonas terrae]|jgi:tripartite-type tricarboxylate transporter receptor subunit TctC|uniref:Tripartite tricarboxylate transporter substrate binding protein n=1 Tax=Neoroseomonas terrae TaxID=424799 RepID=A0ABS5EC89_9PROT|nr:tripartite tricarboxylate transporter substrate binding protein [Neoroseomonas terrae]MBR0648631.1 tripartite tricarboxylate transporter substrate binding protein [Neoroseomonas terrae]
MPTSIARRRMIRGAAAGASALALWRPMTADAQDAYPSRTVRIIVPFAAGGGADAVARALAQKLSERLGQQFVVDNRPGGAGNIGTETAARSSPDGYTVLLTGPSHIINAHLFRQLPFDPMRGFAPISLLTSAPYVLVASRSLPFSSFQELMVAARTSSAPLSYGSAGNGTAGHLAMELIKAEAGIELIHVPYRGSPALLTDLIAGRIAVAFDNVLSSSPAIEAGQLRALAVSGIRRAPSLPNVPTIAEAGIAGFNVTVWQGALFPAGVPEAFAAKLSAEIAAALQEPDLQARLSVLGVDAIGGDPQTFGQFLEDDYRRWGEAVRRSGARLD